MGQVIKLSRISRPKSRCGLLQGIGCLCIAFACCIRSGNAINECRKMTSVRLVVLEDGTSNMDSTRKGLARDVELYLQTSLAPRSQLTWIIMGETLHQVYSMTISDTNRTTMMSTINFPKVPVTLGTEIDNTVIKRAIETNFDSDRRRTRSEILVMLIGDCTREPPSGTKDSVVKKKTVVICLGPQKGPNKWAKIATTSFYMASVQDNLKLQTSEESIGRILCNASYYKCDTDQYRVPRIPKCDDCSNECASSLLRKGPTCTEYCPSNRVSSDSAFHNIGAQTENARPENLLLKLAGFNNNEEEDLKFLAVYVAPTLTTSKSPPQEMPMTGESLARSETLKGSTSVATPTWVYIVITFGVVCFISACIIAVAFILIGEQRRTAIFKSLRDCLPQGNYTEVQRDVMAELSEVEVEGSVEAADTDIDDSVDPVLDPAGAENSTVNGSSESRPWNLPPEDRDDGAGTSMLDDTERDMTGDAEGDKIARHIYKALMVHDSPMNKVHTPHETGRKYAEPDAESVNRSTATSEDGN